MSEKIRIQKYLSECGLMSRRKADEEIALGNITVNGHVAQLGEKVDPEGDAVEYKGKLVENKGSKWYVMLNKPRGYVSTLSDEKGRKCIVDLIADIPERLYPVGRLDLNSEGLLLLTNDGELTNKLTHPAHHVEKIYFVKTKEPVSAEALAKLNKSMVIDDYRIAPAKVDIIDVGVGKTLRFVLKEGRNRQIRKMCELCGVEIARLKRIAVGKILLDETLPSGKWRKLNSKEIGYLKSL